MSTRSSRRSQASASGRSASVSGRNKPQTSGRRASSAAPEPEPARPSGRKSTRASGRAPSAALQQERPATSRGSKRMSAAAPASSREPRQSGRQSKRQLDVSNQYISQRQSAAKKNKTFGMALAIGIVILLVGSAVSLFIFYRGTKYEIQLKQERKEAFDAWVLQNQNKFKSMANGVAGTLKPIYEDIPLEKGSPEVTAALVSKYAAYLRPEGAYYGWCKKSWTVKDKPHAANVSPDNAKEFLPSPTNAAPLGEPMTLTNINGELSQSGTISLFYDVVNKKAVAVLQLNLAPPPVQATAGGPPPKPVPPTQFYLWYETEPMEGYAKDELEARLAAPPERH